MKIAVQDNISEASRPARRAYVVVGMHRSGTSAATRTLSLLGAALPKQLMGENDSNPRGFWEPQSVADLNDEILTTVDSAWDDVFAFQPRHYLSNFDHHYLERAVQLLDQEFGESELIVLKDPRISILTSFWDRALKKAGYSTHYIVMVRNPLEVAESLLTRDGFPREKSLLLWSSYMVALDRDTRDQKRTFISYDQLMSDWRTVRDRIEIDAAVPFPRSSSTAAIEIDRFLDERLHHHKAAPEDLAARGDVFDEVKMLFGIFSDACAGGVVDHTAVDAIEAVLARIDSMVGPLVADLRSQMRSLSEELARRASEARSAQESAKVALEDASAQAKDAEQRFTLEIQAREYKISDLESSVEQRREEASQGWAQVNAERAANEKLTRELELRKAEVEELQVKLRDADKRSIDTIVQLQDTLTKKDAEAGAALETARIEREAMESRLDERFHEIATLSNFLAEAEAAERRLREQAEWLREAGVVLANGRNNLKGRLLGLIPTVFHKKRQERLLKRKGLFDAAAYLAANSDVAAAGDDPLAHYLKHGIKESRYRG